MTSEVPPVEGSQSQARAENCARVEPTWHVKFTVGSERHANMVPHALFNRAADEMVAAVKDCVAAEAEVERLRAENERLREAFTELLEEARDMRSYVPEYFAKKWKHDEALANAQAVLAALGGSQAKGSE